jgi:hypothetical protein
VLVKHYQRGQVLPLWVGAIVTTFMFAFLAINYGNTLRYQIRAQNAADAVAQGLMSIQAERYNAMLVALYGTGVEEYRLRHILDGIMLASNDSGGCLDSLDPNMWTNGTNGGVYPGGGFKPGTCSRVYADLTTQYARSLNRYTVDAQLLNDFSSNTSYTNWKSDVTSLIAHLDGSKCNQPSTLTPNADGSDCGFIYKIVGMQQRTGLLAVQEDAQNILVPGLNRDSTIAPDGENKELFAPAEIDITACAAVPSIVPNFGALHLTTQYAIGRAAATNVQMEEDWLEPGSVYDPAGRPANTFFQPFELYTNFQASSSTTAGDTTEGYNWYGVDFGGNAAVAYVNYGTFDEPFYDNEFSVYTGWWNAIAVKPFVTPAPSVTTTCTGPSTP